MKLIETTNNLHEVKSELGNILSCIDFLFITSLFLEKNVKVLEEVELAQNIKLSKLIEENPKHTAGDLIYNYSSRILTSSQESILMKGLNFALPPKNLVYEDYLLNFELLFRSINMGKNCKEDELSNFKSELRNLSHSSLKFYNRKKKKLENITQEEHEALIELSSYHDIIIQKADKGNVVVIVDKSSYIGKMENILSDDSKFLPITFEGDIDDLKYILNKEQEIKNFLTTLRENEIINKDEFKRMCPVGSKPGILYGLCKVHKSTVGDCPPFRPILSAIGTTSYNLAKYLVPLLSPLTINNYVVKDSFSFATDVRKQNSELYMTSFDVDSLFTNIPLDETIDICVRKIFGKKRKFKGFSKSEFKVLLQYAVKDSLFIFNGKYYVQRDGVAMGSPLGPTLANVFLCHWEEVWLEKCPDKFSPVYYKRYIDDTFVLFSSSDHVKKFHKFLNSRHQNINFTYEVEKDNTLSFLDVLVTREGDKFLTSLYRKPTFSGLYTNFNSFISVIYKKGLIFSLLFRVFTLTVDWNKFHSEVTFLRDIFKKNLFPDYFIDRCIKKFLDKKCGPDNTPSQETRTLKISLPFLGRYSNVIKKRLSSLASKYLDNSKVIIIWNSPRTLRKFFPFKDRLPTHIRSNILYRFTCNGCNSIYYGKTVRHFLVRANEHLGVSLRTGKEFTYNPNNNNNTSILNHIRQSDCNGEFNDFAIIGQARNDFCLRIKESLLIQKFKPDLNNKINSIPLLLFE